MAPLDLSSIGKILVLGGIIIALFGVLLLVINILHIPFLGRLPGDIVIRWGSSTIFFPIVTCIILSVVLTIVVNLVVWLLRR